MVEQYDPSHISVKITKPAAEHFNKYLLKNSGTGIQITIKKNGCSGLSYVINSVDECPKNHLLSVQHGINLFIDSDAKIALDGLEIDYQVKEMGLAQLMYSNPNEKARCGCGESFTVDE